MREPMFAMQSPEKEVSVARALFNNDSEYPNELSFEKGDVLKVISELGLYGVPEGWWLCVDRHGSKGIAPANRLQIMHRFDRGFFQVANPLFDDFFMFSQQSGSPFDDPFFKDRSRIFPDVRERLEPLPIRRMSSCDDALRNVGVVRNIPIKVEKSFGDSAAYTHIRNESDHGFDRRFSDFPHTDSLREIRRTSSSGRVSPPAPPARKYHLTNANTSQAIHSDEEERRNLHNDRSTQRTLIIPSSIPGRTIEIPLWSSNSLSSSRQDLQLSNQDHANQKPETQMERLTQRLKNLTKPFRTPVQSQPDDCRLIDSLGQEHQFKEEPRSPSPSSSGICADTTDFSNSGEDTKRSSDVSSLSSADQNSFLSENNDDARLQHLVTSRHPQQPYMNRLGKEHPPSTSVLQSVFENIEKPEMRQNIQNNSSKEWTIPTSIEEDMRMNETSGWNHIPTKITEQKKGIGNVLEEEIQSRKRIICNKMSDCLHMIDNASNQLKKFTAAQHWRAPHLLQNNLNGLRDAVATISEALDLFVDSTGRISIEKTNHKAAELHSLLNPLMESRSLIGSLRKELDMAGWTVAVLSRDKDQPRTADSLEQFITAVKQMPSDCRRLLQWIQMLVPSSTITFLISTDYQKREIYNCTAGMAQTRSIERPTDLMSSMVFPENKKRLSSSSTSTVTSGDSASLPSSILVTKPHSDKPRGRVTFADENGDRMSTGSSVVLSQMDQKSPGGNHTLSRIQESRIVEEDDLESVVSDRESLFQDYAYLDEVISDKSSTYGNKSIRTVLSDEDRQLTGFYAPQIDQHTEALSLAIEEFLATVENNLPPREFVQKGKMIILAAHKLIYIGDTISQCLTDKMASLAIRDCSDRLCSLLKECVKATKLASDEYPEIRRMQSMVDSIISVSKSAHELKLLVRGCC